MEGISHYLSTVAAAAILVSVIISITLNGNAKKTVIFCTGLLLIIVVIKPVLSLKDAKLEELIEFENEPSIDEVIKTGINFTATYIAERTSAYIVNKAQALGLKVTVSVQCKKEVALIVPESIIVWSKVPMHAENALKSIIAQELGIPLDKQRFAAYDTTDLEDTS